jgi:hypothetical protein
MRATTFWISYVSRAIRAVRMFELSPLVTAASAPASRIPACSRWSRSNPNPRTARPVNFSGRRRKAFLFLSTDRDRVALGLQLGRELRSDSATADDDDVHGPYATRPLPDQQNS